ncbi:COG1470 family protein [Microbacterium forte]
MNFRRRVLGGGLAVLILASAPLVASAASGSAAVPVSASAGDVTWSVAPADEAGPDGRRWVEQELDPGESVEDHLAVRNLSATDIEFRLSAADGYFTEGGSFNMLPSDQESVDAGTWIEVQPSVLVPAGEVRVVPFSLHVPEGAVPGDHPAGIAASVLSQGQTADGTAVGLESRVGFRVMTRVTGELAPVLAIDAVDAHFDSGWNPFVPGRLSVSYSVENAGNLRMGASSTVDFSGPLGWGQSTVGAESIADSFPGEARIITVETSAWPLMLLFGSVAVKAEPVDGIAASVPLPTQSVSYSVWAVPWPQIALALLLAFTIWAFMSDRRRRRRKLKNLLEQAREEGRSEERGGVADAATPRVASIVSAAALGTLLLIFSGGTAAYAADADSGSITIVVDITETEGTGPALLAATGVDMNLVYASLLVAAAGLSTGVAVAAARRRERGHRTDSPSIRPPGSSSQPPL